MALSKRYYDKTTGFVYFAEAIGADAVKIGFCWTDCRARVKSMQSHNHCELRLVTTISGPPELESELHNRFLRHRIHGEWFKLGKDLRDFIDSKRRKPLVLSKAIEVRCYKCRWEGKRTALEERCPQCNYWCPLPLRTSRYHARLVNPT